VATITDRDGDVASAAVNIGTNLVFEDDAGTLGAFSGPTVVANAQNATGNGTFAYNPGADGHGSFSITGPAPTGITHSTVQNAAGALLTGTSDPDGPGGNPAVTVYTLQVNTNGTYNFTLVTPAASTTNSVSLLGLSPGGPTPFVETPDGKVEFTGSGNGINSSTQGFGVSNQFVGNGESFTIEFHETGAAGNQASTVDPRYVSSATLFNDNINGSLTVTVTFHNDATNQTEVQVIAVTGTTTLLDPTTMSQFNWVEVVGTGGSGQGVRFTRLDYETTILPQDFSLSFNVSATDRDGDVTVIQPIIINVDATPPVVLDLDGDGVEFLGLSAGVAYDYGHGSVGTAWAGPDDGILVRDANGNGLVDDASEFVFGGNGQTDMEALHAQYGEQLDASDADFVMFAVWNDANSNGIADAGELSSLAEAGIASIGLVSDGNAYSAANGDVAVAGTSTFTRTDGTTGDVADAAFRTGSRSVLETERVAANSNNVVLAAAIAAAGLAASTSAAASVDTAGVATVKDTNPATVSEVIDLSILGLSTHTALSGLMGGMGDAFGTVDLSFQSAISRDFGNSIGELAGGQFDSMGSNALLQGTDMIAGQTAMPMLASNVAMPSADALVAMAGLNTVQSSVTVEAIVADALQGGGGPDINALLNALPTQGIGPNAGTDALASLGSSLVPTWDTGQGTGFTFAGSNLMTTEALVLHHDAIQPVANG